mgnify:CR=1 FL=1
MRVNRIALPLPSATQNLTEQPVFRVRASGTALLIAEIFDTGKYHCSVEELQHLVQDHQGKHDQKSITWKGDTWWSADGDPQCARHIAILSLPLAGRYYIEALKMYADFDVANYEDTCMLPEAQRLLFRTVLHASHPEGGDARLGYIWYRQQPGPPSAVQTRYQHRWPIYFDPKEAWCWKTLSLQRYVKGPDSCELAKPSFKTKNETLLAELFPPLASESVEPFKAYGMGVIGSRGTHARPAPELHRSDAWFHSKEVLCMQGISHSRYYCQSIPGCHYTEDYYMHGGVSE